MTRGLVAAPLGQVTVLSLMKVTAVLRGPQYPITSTSVWLHSPLHAAPVQSRRTTRVAFSAVPGGPGGPAGPGGSTLTRGALGGGGSPGVRYTSPFAPAGGRIGAATSCASAQLQHPRQVEPPSRRPIWPKRAAIPPRSAPKREA